MSFNLEHINTADMITAEEALKSIVDSEYEGELTVCLPVNRETIKAGVPEAPLVRGFAERFGYRLKASGKPYTNYTRDSEAFDLMYRKQTDKFLTLPKAVIVRVQLGGSAIHAVESEFVMPVAAMGQQHRAVSATFAYDPADTNYKSETPEGSNRLFREVLKEPKLNDNPYLAEVRQGENDLRSVVHHVTKHKVGDYVIS